MSLLSVFGILFTLWVLGVELSDACSCQQSHKQQHYCTAKFAMQVLIQSSEVVYYNSSQHPTEEGNYPTNRIYHLYKTKVFKKSPEWDEVVNKSVIYTAYQESLCGRTFKANEKYFITGFIAGGKLWTNLCYWGEEWSGMPMKQRRLVRKGYNSYCNMCSVKACYQCKKLRVNPGSCYWNINSEFASCYDRYAICKCKEDASGQPQCRWSYGRRYSDGRINEFNACYKTIQKRLKKHPKTSYTSKY